MNLLHISRLRRNFRNTIDIRYSLYENKVTAKFGESNQTTHNLLIKSSINKENYLFYKAIEYIRYKKAIDMYQNTIISNPNVNDVRKTLILFFPYLLKSINFDERIVPLKPDGFTNIAIGNKITEFIENYKELEKRGMLLHRLEMFYLLEVFLNMLTVDEETRMTSLEKKDYLLFHYFRPFIRPELYFNNEKDDI
jgi:hypothetical protein